MSRRLKLLVKSWETNILHRSRSSTELAPWHTNPIYTKTLALKEDYTVQLSKWVIIGEDGKCSHAIFAATRGHVHNQTLNLSTSSQPTTTPSLDKPDPPRETVLAVVARVFELKCKAISAELKAVILGEYAGMVWTVEFQKRGLPHRHIILFLTPEAGRKYKDPLNVDRCVFVKHPTRESGPTGVKPQISFQTRRSCGAKKSKTFTTKQPMTTNVVSTSFASGLRFAHLRDFRRCYRVSSADKCTRPLWV